MLLEKSISETGHALDVNSNYTDKAIKVSSKYPFCPEIKKQLMSKHTVCTINTELEKYYPVKRLTSDKSKRDKTLFTIYSFKTSNTSRRRCGGLESI